MTEIETLEGLEALFEAGGDHREVAFQGLDLRPYSERLRANHFDDCLFLGCSMAPDMYDMLARTGNTVFPLIEVPFMPYRGGLYTRDELYEGFDAQAPETYTDSLDARIHAHYVDTGGAHATSIRETLARRLHDHAISDALQDFLMHWGEERRIVAVMGGHGMARGETDYHNVARIGRALAAEGYLLVTGGGPGAMEATHLGVAFSHRSESELERAISVLAQAPHYTDAHWLSTAFGVIDAFDLQAPNSESIGVPTWLYGHEPPNPFPTRIAKYFDNSVREEGLLSMAKGGVIYAPGSAGTIQEIFQDACQNHYESFGYPSPMVFLNTDYWTRVKPVYPLVRQLAEGRDYERLLNTTSSAEEAVRLVRRFGEA